MQQHFWRMVAYSPYFRYPNLVVRQRFRIHRQLRDLHEQRPCDAAPGMDSEGRERQ